MKFNQKYQKVSPSQINIDLLQQHQVYHKNSSSFEQQIHIKNINSGSYQLFNVQQVDSVTEIKDFKSAQTKVSLWNSYWEEVSKNDVKLLKLILNKDLTTLKKILIQQPIQLNSFKYIDGWTLLHHAILNSSQQIVKLLIQNKIDVDMQSSQMKRTALHQTVLANKVSMANILVQTDLNLNIQDVDGNTALHYAAELSYFQIFQLLIRSNKFIDFSLKNYQQMTVLDCVRDQKIYKLIQQLYPEAIHQNQNLPDHLENRRVIKFKDDVIIKRYSKSDLIEKFLSLKVPAQKTQQDKKSLTKSINSNSSNDSKKKHALLGKKPSHWIQKKGQLIASQSICLMKQSVIEPSENETQQIYQDLSNYVILRFLGQGGFAQVFLARKKKSTSLFALKRINKHKIIQNNLKRYVYSQRNLMIKCIHPFIIQPYSMFQDDAHLYIAMEYCQCGDLQKLISQRGNIQQRYAKIYAAQIGLALEQIHSKNILFRDLKPANVLLCKNGNSKISDFGLAKQSQMSFSFLGSVQYLAPEMLVDSEMKQHTKSIDWYLYGVLIYQMVTGKIPFYGQKQHVLFKKIKQQKPQYPAYLSKQCRSLLQKLLQKKPQNRLGSKEDFLQIRSQGWFKDIDFHKVLKREYKLPLVEPLIKQADLMKKIPIDNIPSNQKYQYFKQWNYVRQN